MKNNHSKLLKWFAALSFAGLAVSCASSEPINGFDPYGSSGTGGGVTATGGSGTGGVTATGGSPGTGGIPGTGGTPGTGGSATGGSPGTGGSVPGTGGQVATGGAGGRAAGSGGTGGSGNGGRAGGAAGGHTGGGGAGGASNATFAFVSMTIMQNCGGTTCHNGSQSVKFDTTTNLYMNLTTMTAPDCKGLPLVTPGNPSMSALYLAISKMCGGTLPQMPDGKSPLPAATISSIQTWIQNGAPQQ